MSSPALCSRLAILFAMLAPCLTEAQSTDAVAQLDRFITTESAVERSTTLLPTSRPVDSVYGFSRSLVDTPRSVTVITPEALVQRGLTTVYDLAAVVPGSTVINYYGVPGVPTTRGLTSSLYFNGMQRVWNRNGFPTSFGSFESMDYVRGPAPGTYGATSPGGFVNFIPKSPYYDKRRGSIKVTVGENNEYNAQVDIGGPLLAFGKPAAFRVSVTGQKADSFYEGIKNDYTSVYGSFKMRVSDAISLFGGGEYYSHRSKENPGWNRVTQDLIDHGNYVFGAPLNDLTGGSLRLTLPSGKVLNFVNTSPGFVNRAALETATPFGGTRGDFDGSFLAMNGFATSGFRPDLTAANADATYLYRYLGAINNPGARTVKLDASRIVTDAPDYTNADTTLFFLDAIATPSSTLKVSNKFFVDAYSRDKVSSYGYGELGRNITLEDKILVEQQLTGLGNTRLAYGTSLRYEDSLAKTEFTVEPFSRRDLSAGPSSNDRLRSGDQRDSGGINYWDPFGSFESQLLTVGVFLNPEISFNDRFSLLLSARWDNASWDRAVPFDLGADFNSGPRPSGGISYTNFSLSPVFKLSPTVSAYATAQKGTSYQGYFVSGSVDLGDANFQESSLAEVGVKTSAWEGTLFAAVDVFYQELVHFDARGGAAIPQRGKGVEAESTLVISRALTLTGNVTWQQHFFRTETLPGGFVPLTAEEITRYAGIYYADFGGRPNPGGPRFGIPEWTGSLFANYSLGRGLGMSGGPTFTSSVWGNADKTLRLPSFTLWNVSLSYTRPTWDVIISGKNLFNERYFHPYDAFAANAVILPGEPSHYSVALRLKF